MKKINDIYLIKLVTLAILFLISSFSVAQDPGVVGPYSVLSAEYNHGDSAYTPAGFPRAVEVKASVHYPSDLSEGNFPLVVFMHGRHVTCYSGSTVSLQWPCSDDSLSIPSYQGFDYISDILASHGYIVVSISANGINAVDNSVSDFGMNARALLLQHHLDLWDGFNTSSSGDFGNLFVGKVDMNNVGTMGHSRGGEGVAGHFVLNESLGSPYGIHAVLPLAPTNFNRTLVDEVPLGVILPYCDGDTSDLQGVHFYDDARYSSVTDNSPKHTFLVMGANHNFFNAVWTPGLFTAGTFDDWIYSSDPLSDPHCGSSSSDRLNSVEQQGAGLAFITAFFRTYLGGEEQFKTLLTGDSVSPNSAQGSIVHASYHAPANERLDVNRLNVEDTEITNTLGVLVTQSSSDYNQLCGSDSGQQHCLVGESSFRQPHTAESFPGSHLGLGQLILNWSDSGDWYSNGLPSRYSDIRTFDHIQFRAGVNFIDNPMEQDQDFHIELWDTSGAVSSIRVSDVSDALFYPPGDSNLVPKLFLNTIRIPLSLFDNVDMSNISEIRFSFGETTKGAILVSDITLTKESTPSTIISRKVWGE